MIWSSPKFLELCYQLKKTTLDFVISPGARVARGYADVGFEEFCVLKNNKMVSIHTGDIFDLELEHVFVVPTVEELLKALPKEFEISVNSTGIIINNREYDSFEIGLVRELLLFFNVKSPTPRIVAV